jgi:phospholipid transport system substrate-binding protein
MKRSLALIFLACSWANALADSTTIPPQQVVAMTADHVLTEVRRDQQALQGDPHRLLRILDERLMPHVDFAHIARWSLGKHWRKASAEQRQRFTSAYRHLLMRTYANALLELAQHEITYLPVRAARDADDVTVRSVVHVAGANPIAINYDLHLSDGQWLAYDISIDGISLVSNYRSSFANEMRRGDIERLIAMLEKRNQTAIK